VSDPGLHTRIVNASAAELDPCPRPTSRTVATSPEPGEPTNTNSTPGSRTRPNSLKLPVRAPFRCRAALHRPTRRRHSQRLPDLDTLPPHFLDFGVSQRVAAAH
jgi:hypothetical protein